MRHITILLEVSAVLTIATVSNCQLLAGQFPDDSRDIVMLSQNWWGASIEDFPRLAHLKSDEFSAGDDPVPNSHEKVIYVQANRLAGKWTPAEIPPFSFQFSSDQGLHVIRGFLGDELSKASLLNTLVSRYGQYDLAGQGLGFQTYVWRFPKTILEVSFNGDKPFIYKITPNSSR